MVRIVDQSAYDLTVFKVHFGALTLKLYDKGVRELRRTFDTLLISVAPGNHTNSNMFASTSA